MQIQISQLKEIIRKALDEAAAQGKMQKIYRNSFKKMINLARSGGNKYKAKPFNKKAAGPGKSGLGPH
tara:strand:- start:258 stop:461 length:204 start_codon:yes stop_codon:yes gene_type:complete